MAVTIAPKYAEGLKSVGKANTSGTGGTTTTDIVQTTIVFGGSTFSNVIAVSQDTQGVSGLLGTKVDGMLGEEILSQFKSVTIDYEHQVIVLTR